MATIYDIAQFCNTSTATVSYVLNGNGDKHRISKSTQEKIYAAAEALKYRPNTSAKRLSQETGQNMVIALFWPGYSFEQSILSVLRAIRKTTAMLLEPLEISLQFYEPGRLAEKKDLLSSQIYHGILLVGAGEKDLAFLTENHPPVPVVLVNRTLAGFPAATIDHQTAGRMACDLVVKKGGESVSTFWEQAYHIATNARKDAFFQRCKEIGVNLTNLQFYCDSTEESGYEQGIRMIQKGQLSKVIFCNQEQIARGLSCALLEFGIAVGKDVELLTTSIAPDSFCRYSSPPLSAIDLKMQAIAEKALALCLRLISHQSVPESVVTFQPIVIFRDSFSAELPGQ